MNDAGLICLTAFVVPLDQVRERARTVIGPDRFLEVYLSAPIEELKRRDQSGLFEAAERGEIPSFPRREFRVRSTCGAGSLARHVIARRG